MGRCKFHKKKFIAHNLVIHYLFSSVVNCHVSLLYRVFSGQIETLSSIFFCPCTRFLCSWRGVTLCLLELHILLGPLSILRMTDKGVWTISNNNNNSNNNRLGKASRRQALLFATMSTKTPNQWESWTYAKKGWPELWHTH